MTATNHVMTGVGIAVVIANPAIGLPLALISHLILDIVPHFGVNPEKIKVFVPVLLTDMLLASAILMTLVIARPPEAWYLILAGVVAASPDLLSIPRFIAILKHQPYEHGTVQRFLSWIQRSETVPGIIIELTWLVIVGSYVIRHV